MLAVDSRYEALSDPNKRKRYDLGVDLEEKVTCFFDWFLFVFHKLSIELGPYSE